MRLENLPGFNLQDLNEALLMGYVNVRHHPSLPLRIFNYSDKAQYAPGIWNHTVRACRGLIVNDTDEIVARPFPKFFNYGQPEAAQIPLTSPVVVTDKLDGSLGIVYPHGDGNFSVATRGSFESEQATKGTEMLQEIIRKGWFNPFPDLTYLVEIIYPENRVVVNYGSEEKLVLLGVVSNDAEFSGRKFVSSAVDAKYYGEWLGDTVEIFPYNTLAEALKAGPRPNAEDLVVMDTKTYSMVKIKQDSYLQIHRIRFSMTPRRVWEILKSGRSLEDIYEGLPDELFTDITEIGNSLLADFTDWKSAALNEFALIPNCESRAEFAKIATQSNYRSALFQLYDGKSIDELVWKAIKPNALPINIENP